MGIWEQIEKLPAKYIHIIILLCVIVPLIFPFTVPIPISAQTQEWYNYIESAPAGSRVLVRASCSLQKNFEQYPLQVCIFEQLLKHDFKILIGGPDSLPTANEAMVKALGAFERKKYGVDFVIIGNIPGADPAYIAFCEDIHGIIKADVYGTLIEDIPMMKEFNNINDIDFIVSIAGSDEALHSVRNVFGQKYGKPVLLSTGVTGIGRVLDWYKIGLIRAVVWGQKGAAEYETLMSKPGLGLAGVAAQSVVFYVVIGLIIIGNISSYVIRARVQRKV